MSKASKVSEDQTASPAPKLSKADQLRKINEQKKLLTEQQKALKLEMSESAEERKESRGIQATSRKDVHKEKATLRDLGTSINAVFSKGSRSEVINLADNIVNSATALAATIRKFGESMEEGLEAEVEAEVETEDDEL